LTWSLTATATATKRPETSHFVAERAAVGSVHVAVAVKDHVNDNAYDNAARAPDDVGAAVLGLMSRVGQAIVFLAISSRLVESTDAHA